MSEPLSIIYADDDDDIRELLQLSLELAGGFQVRSVSDGRAAIAEILADPPDLVILDVMMPGLDGPAALAELRNSSASDIPVIFFTAKLQPEEIDRLMALGATAVLSKPFDPIAIADEITAVWKAHHER